MSYWCLTIPREKISVWRKRMMISKEFMSKSQWFIVHKFYKLVNLLSKDIREILLPILAAQVKQATIFLGWSKIRPKSGCNLQRAVHYSSFLVFFCWIIELLFPIYVKEELCFMNDLKWITTICGVNVSSKLRQKPVWTQTVYWVVPCFVNAYTNASLRGIYS